MLKPLKPEEIDVDKATKPEENSDMQRTARIKVTRELSQRIAEVVCSEIKTSREKNSKIYKLADRCEKQYNQVTAFQAIGKKKTIPWEGSADYFVPMSEWMVDAVHARIMNTLFSQEPYMTASGTQGEDVDKAPHVTDFVDSVFRNTIHLRENTSYFFKQMCKIPTAVAKYEWVQDFDPLIIKESALQFLQPETGKEKLVLITDEDLAVKRAECLIRGFQEQEEPVEVWVLKEIETQNAPELKYIKFDDYVWCPGTMKNQKPYWEGDRVYMTMHELKTKSTQQDLGFIKDSYKHIKDSANLSDKEGNERIIAERAEMREVYWWYGKLPFNSDNEVDFEADETYEQEVILLVDFNAIELIMLKHWDHRRVPKNERVYLRESYDETDGFVGRSLCQKIYQSQKYVNQIYNTIMDNAWLAMQKIFVKKRKLVGKEKWRRPKVFPGAIWEVSDVNDVSVLNIGDVKTIGIEIQNTLINYAERLSNIPVFKTGTSTDEKKTATEIEIVTQEGNIGLDTVIRRCHRVLREICKMTVDYYYDRMPPGLERHILTDSGEKIFPSENNLKYYKEKEMYPFWRKGDLAGSYDFEWRGTALTSSRARNIAIANDLQDRFMQVDMVQGNLIAVWEILKKGLDARGIKDWRKILPPKEAIIAEMKTMRMEEEARKKSQASGTAEDRAIQKLEQQGISREEAIKLVSQKMQGGQSVNN